jgi:hypothetical protein
MRGRSQGRGHAHTCSISNQKPVVFSLSSGSVIECLRETQPKLGSKNRPGVRISSGAPDGMKLGTPMSLSQLSNLIERLFQPFNECLSIATIAGCSDVKG